MPSCPTSKQDVNHVPGLMCKRRSRFVPRESLPGNHSPLEGESQKPSRQAKADAVGGEPGRQDVAAATPGRIRTVLID